MRGLRLLALTVSLAAVSLITDTPPADASVPAWHVSRLPVPDNRGWPFDAEAIACPGRHVCYVAGDTFINWAGYPAVETLHNNNWSTTAFPSVHVGDMQATLTTLIACPDKSLCLASGSGGPGNNQTGEYAQSYTLSRQNAPWRLDWTGAQGGFLKDLSCRSRSSCLGAGYTLTCSGPDAGISCTQEDFVEVYTAGSWTQRLAPLVKGQSRSFDATLDKVACSTRGSCVAIGSYDAPRGKPSPSGPSYVSPVPVLVTIANGRLSARRAPLPSNAVTGQLSAVACPKAGHCLAVGSYRTSWNEQAKQHPLFESETGAGWKASTLPLHDDEAIVPELIECPAVSLCFAAGRASLNGRTHLVGFERSGSHWIEKTLPYDPTRLGPWSESSSLSSMACSSTYSCIAVGATTAPAWQSTGSSWSLSFQQGSWDAERVPNPRGLVQSFAPDLRDVTVEGDRYVAVGEFYGPDKNNRFPDGKAMAALYP